VSRVLCESVLARTTDRAGRLPGARPCPGSGRCPKQDARPSGFLGRCPKQDARPTRLLGRCPKQALPTQFLGRCPKQDARPTRFLGRCSKIRLSGAGFEPECPHRKICVNTTCPLANYSLSKKLNGLVLTFTVLQGGGCPFRFRAFILATNILRVATTL